MNPKSTKWILYNKNKPLDNEMLLCILVLISLYKILLTLLIFIQKINENKNSNWIFNIEVSQSYKDSFTLYWTNLK